MTGPTFRALSFSKFADVIERGGLTLFADFRISFSINPTDGCAVCAKKLALVTSVQAKGVRVFLRRRLSAIDLQHEVLRLGSVARVVQIVTSSGWPFQVSVTIVPAVDGKTAVIAGEFGACGHGGDQEGWALGGNPDLQLATRSIWFTRSHPDLSDRHKTALNEIENHMTSLI
jgi:hypothetical protein